MLWSRLRSLKKGLLRRSQVEDDMALVECFGERSSCPLSGACALAGALDDARTAFLAVLDRVTLADLLPRPRGAMAVVAFPAALRTRARAPVRGG